MCVCVCRMWYAYENEWVGTTLSWLFTGAVDGGEADANEKQTKQQQEALHSREGHPGGRGDPKGASARKMCRRLFGQGKTFRPSFITSLKIREVTRSQGSRLSSLVRDGYFPPFWALRRRLCLRERKSDSSGDICWPVKRPGAKGESGGGGARETNSCVGANYELRLTIM